MTLEFMERGRTSNSRNGKSYSSLLPEIPEINCPEADLNRETVVVDDVRRIPLKKRKSSPFAKGRSGGGLITDIQANPRPVCPRRLLRCLEPTVLQPSSSGAGASVEGVAGVLQFPLALLGGRLELFSFGAGDF